MTRGAKGGVSAADRWTKRLAELPRSVAHWSDVPCIRWDGAFYSPNGYGAFSFEKRTRQAHRVAFKLFYGRYPEPCGCHHCDNKWCMNPLHIFEGSRAENTQDAAAKGILPRGIQAPGHRHRKVDPTRVRDLLKFDLTHKEIAKWLGISAAHVSLIKLGKFRGICA
jgi:hypothetical protein